MTGQALMAAPVPVPKDQPPALTISEEAIHQAVKDTVAETPAKHLVPPSAGDTFGVDSREGKLARAFDEAKVPDCLHSDAMKLAPPKIGQVELAEMYALPFWGYAVLSGKCR